LSNNDAFALVLAKIEKCVLLVSNSASRHAAADENVKVYGHLQLADEMENYGMVTRKRLLGVLATWEDDLLV